MLARGVAVAQLFGGLHRSVEHLHEILARDDLHDAGHLRHLRQFGFHVRLDLRRFGADALDDSGKVVLACFRERLQQVDGLDSGRFGVRSDDDGLLQRLLRCQRQFV